MSASSHADRLPGRPDAESRELGSCPIQIRLGLPGSAAPPRALFDGVAPDADLARGTSTDAARQLRAKLCLVLDRESRAQTARSCLELQTEARSRLDPRCAWISDPGIGRPLVHATS